MDNAINLNLNSKPFLEGFNPYIIPMQGQLMDLISGWDYSKSTPEILLSGAYGSSKSIIMAHIAIIHCLQYPGACVLLGRKALPDLKKTIFNEICEHLDTDSLIYGQHYTVKETTAEVDFYNGSKIISGTWSDKRYKKFRSLKISGFIFEEAAENNLDDREAFMSIKARLRRIPTVPQNFLIAATNPDAPEHWLYEYFILGQKTHNTRKVLYSVTSDNPFLDPVYIEQLLNDLSPKEARRYVYGEWISLVDEVIYYEYNPDVNFINDTYIPDPAFPIIITFDFNIGDGKPMSCCLLQYVDDEFHAFAESVIFSGRTMNILEDLSERNLLNPDYSYIICGDAAGKNRDTRNKRSDYQIIYDFFDDNDLSYEKKIPPANPAIRKRHNLVNRYCLNAVGKSRLFVYKGCTMLDKGLKLTKLKKGAGYIEDDSPSCPWQHITTALGYAIVAMVKASKRKSELMEL